MICELVGGSKEKDSEGWRENVLSTIVSSNSTHGDITALGCPHLLDGRAIHRSCMGSEEGHWLVKDSQCVGTFKLNIPQHLHHEVLEFICPRSQS